MSKLLRIPTLVAFAMIAGVTLFTAGCGSDHGRVRVVHASPDAPNVDVLVDGKKVLTNVAYKTASPYLTLETGSRKVQVRATGTSTDAITATATIASRKDYTILAVGKLATISALALQDDNSAPAAGQIKLRVIHASPSAGNVDVYVVAPGTDITTVTPTLSNVAFKTASAYLSVAAGSYEVIVTAPGSKVSVIDSGSLTFTAGQIRTVVALDEDTTGTNFTAIVLSDRN
jgi:hypothetical protein